MTEDEAKTKRCWQSHGGPLGGPCAGSLCMAWREIVKEVPVFRNGSEAKPGEAYARSEVVKTNRHVLDNYCGLVGKP